MSAEASAIAFLSEARSCVEVDEIRRAKVLVEKALALAPDSYDVRMGAGDLFLAMDRSEFAHHCFAAAIELDPARVEAYRARGLALLGEGRAGRAVADLSKALALAPGDAQLTAALARASAAKPVTIAGARPIARVALPVGDDAPFLFPVPFSRAVQLQGDLSAAWCPPAERAVDDALLASRACAIAGDLEGAVRALDGWAGPRVETRRCLLAFASGDDAVAASFLEAWPLSEEGERRRPSALAAAMRGRIEEAASELSGKDLAGAGLVWLVGGRFAEARRDLSYAVETVSSAEVFTHLGVASLGCADFGRARDAFTRAADLRPSRSSDRRWRGVVEATTRLGLALLAGDAETIRAAVHALRRAGDDDASEPEAQRASLRWLGR